MTANKWYCIAQSSTFDSSCGITIYSEGVAVSFTASVRYGSSSINIASCAIDGDILLSVRLRETDNKWCIDLLCNTEFNPTIDITDSPYWEVQNTPAGTGSILAIINDISKEFNTGVKGGESLWRLYNFGTQEKPEYAVVPKDYDGKPIGVVSKTFISFGGHNSGAEEGTGGGITTFDVYIGNDGPYSLVNGRVDLPAYPTANLTGYATENWVKEQGYLTQHQDISHLLGKEEAKDIYATIIALNEVSDRVETIESIIGIDSKGNVYIKKKADGTARDFYTYGAISFGGNGENSGSGEIIGSSVQYNASVTSGKLLGTLVIDGVDNKIYAPAIPTKLSAFTNDEGYATEGWVNGQGFLTNHQSLTHLLSKTEAAETYQPKGNYVTESALNGKGYLTQSKAEDTYQPKGDYAVLDDLNSYLLISAAKNTYATIQALNGATTRIKTLESTLETEQGYIDTLQGYFTSGKAKKAIADGNGNNIVDTYATKAALKDVADKVATLQDMWFFDEAHADTIRTLYNVVVDKAISFGGYGESSGSGGGITTVTYDMVVNALGYTPYNSTNPKGYITSSALNGYAKLTDIPSLENYATTGTTLSHYGITDAYTKTQVDNKLVNYLTTNTAQTILASGAKIFKGAYGENIYIGGTKSGITIDINAANGGFARALSFINSASDASGYVLFGAYGNSASGFQSAYIGVGEQDYNNAILNIYKDSIAVAGEASFSGLTTHSAGLKIGTTNVTEKSQNNTKYVEIDGNLVVTGAISFGGFGEGGSTSGGITSVTKDMVIDALGYTPYNAANPNGYITSSALSGYATQTWVENKGYFASSNFTKANIKSTLGISDWALAASKPTYTKSDVGLGNVTNLAASGYLTDLSSDATNAVSITVGGITKNISASTLKTSMGLGSLAYKSGLVASDIPSLDWSKITSGKPTTLSGYGITNAYTKSEVNSTFLGINGKAVDSDKLDGYHYSDVLNNTLKYGYKDATLNAIGWYRIAKLTGYGSYMLSISGLYYNVNPTSASFIINKSYTSVKVSQIGAASIASMVTSVRIVKDASTASIMYVEVYMNSPYSGQPFAYKISPLRDGLNYDNYSMEMLDATATTDSLEELVKVDIIVNADVYSASKLATSRTIWGQRFDGTEDVSGSLSNVTNINMSGNLVASGSITFGSASDRRLKDNIKSMTDKQAVAVLSALNPVTFKWNSTAYELGKLSGISDGFIADEYEKLIPNSGRDIWANYRAINYERATGYLVKGWQNHETRLEKAERRIKELENELKQYRRT